MNTLIPNTEKEELIDLGDESIVQRESLKLPAKGMYEIVKKDVHPYDIFKLAKAILIASASIFLVIALIRIFYTDPASGIKEVWDYSKEILKDIVLIVIGLYFGKSQDSKR